MVNDKSDFEKVAAYLLVLSVGIGVYPMAIMGEFMHKLDYGGKVEQTLDQGVPDEISRIFKSWTEKDESMFLIYFGSECMEMLEVSEHE